MGSSVDLHSVLVNAVVLRSILGFFINGVVVVHIVAYRNKSSETPKAEGSKVKQG